MWADLSVLSRVLAFFAIAVLPAAVAHAETLTFQCQEQQFSASSGQAAGTVELALVYEGAESGVLELSGSFGDVELPATKVEQDSEATGKTIHVIGIRAAGQATALMPVKAEIEACVTAKSGGETLDADMVTYHVNSCRLQAVRPPEPAAITASVELTFLGPDGSVLISRTYAEPSELAGGEIRLDTWPMPQCTLLSRD